jgi:exosortase A-associated hydrolase 1
VTYRELPFFFECEGTSLLGVLTTPGGPPRLGVVIVVGGPQYRVGSHRQFVLLARALASAGIACLRFDYRGMGDSEGGLIEFDALEPDIRAAVAALCEREQSIEAIVLWGLCNGASASALFGDVDPRIRALVLFNPWVRTTGGNAEATMRRYYANRIHDRRFWRKLLRGDVDVAAATSSLLRNARAALGGLAPRARSVEPASLPERVSAALARHRRPALIAISGRDIVANEFDLAASRPGMLRDEIMRANRRCVRLEDADHTFSTTRAMDQATDITMSWLREQFPRLLSSGRAAS